MAGGTHAKTPTGYFETEYCAPWPGIDVSLPASRIEPGACVSVNGMVIRGGLTNAPALVAPQGVTYPIVPPDLAPGEVIGLVTNLAGVTVIITNFQVYTDYSTSASTSKVFTSVYTFGEIYSTAPHFGSVVIGNNLYFSSAERLGVYALGFSASVTGLTLTSGGSGFTSNPTVVISGGGGTGATGTATFAAGTPVTFPLQIWPNTGSTSFRNSFTITPPPDNEIIYSTGVVNGFIAGGTAVVSGCANTALNGTGPLLVDDIILPFTTFPSGANFVVGITNSAPYAPYTGEVGGSVTYTPPGVVNSITLTVGGSGYTSAPTVTIIGPPGTGATAIATLGPIVGMSVSEITARNGSGPFIGGDFLGTIGQRLVIGNIIGGDGNQSLSVASIQLINGGSGYPNSGSLIFTGGGGQNAAATFTAAGGTVTGITLTNPGSGYVSAPTATIFSPGGTGFLASVVMTTAIEYSTENLYPDYFAWSFPSAYGFFDPNITQFAGGFQQLTEARGKITGIAVFESVAFIAHNGGFTEAVVNTSSIAGVNVQPFTFNPLWSADQGVVCRYGSMAQYGATVGFLGQDQVYSLSPNGLSPVGDKVASLLQNFSLWVNGQFPDAGLYGSIVEIEGEKHYLVAFTHDDQNFTGNGNRRSLIYDFNMKTWACSTWNYNFMTITCPIYQSYDSQNMSGNILAKDNLLLTGLQLTASGNSQSQVVQAICGDQLFNSTATQIAPPAFAFQFRFETPAMGRSQSTRRICVEYENIPALQGTAVTLTASLIGQPDINNQQTVSVPPRDVFTLPLPYLQVINGVIVYSVLTTFGEPVGSTFNGLATSLSIATTGLVRIIRTGMVSETAQGELK